MTRNSQHGTQKPSAWYALGLTSAWYALGLKIYSKIHLDFISEDISKDMS